MSRPYQKQWRRSSEELAPTRTVIEVARSPWVSRLLRAQGHDVVFRRCDAKVLRRLESRLRRQAAQVALPTLGEFFKFQSAVYFQMEFAAAYVYQPHKFTAFVKTATQQDQSRLQIVLDIRQPHACVQPDLFI